MWKILQHSEVSLREVQGCWIRCRFRIVRNKSRHQHISVNPVSLSLEKICLSVQEKICLSVLEKSVSLSSDFRDLEK